MQDNEKLAKALLSEPKPHGLRAGEDGQMKENAEGVYQVFRALQQLGIFEDANTPVLDKLSSSLRQYFETNRNTNEDIARMLGRLSTFIALMHRTFRGSRALKRTALVFVCDAFWKVSHWFPLCLRQKSRSSARGYNGCSAAWRMFKEVDPSEQVCHA